MNPSNSGEQAIFLSYENLVLRCSPWDSWTGLNNTFDHWRWCSDVSALNSLIHTVKSAGTVSVCSTGMPLAALFLHHKSSCVLSNHVVPSSHLAFLHWMMQKCTFVAGTCCSECLYRLVRKSECTALWRLRDADLDRVGLEGQNLQVCLGFFLWGR